MFTFEYKIFYRIADQVKPLLTCLLMNHYLVRLSGKNKTVMKKFILLLSLLSFWACQMEEEKKQATQVDEITLNFAEDQATEFDQLRLYPITTAAATVERNKVAANYLSLGEAMNQSRFRITEKKPYGRFNDPGAVNTLTVQNKTQDTVYLMSGDVVKGGKQDRIIAEDLLVAPRTIVDVPVFCVEPHRWDYQDEKAYAFTGYYNVAATRIRKSLRESRSQHDVWDKVQEITSVNNAETETGTYTALENSTSYTDLRDDYLQYIESNFSLDDHTVGMIAVSGNEVLGIEVFGHPDLFRRQFKALLHSYITDAITQGQPVTISASSLQRHFKVAVKDINRDRSSSRFSHGEAMIHYSQF